MATCPAHLNLLDLITLTILGERCKLWSSLLWSLFHSLFSSLLGPNICLRILFSNAPSLHFSLNVRDHVSQQYSTCRRGNVLKILKYTNTLYIWSNHSALEKNPIAELGFEPSTSWCLCKELITEPNFQVNLGVKGISKKEGEKYLRYGQEK